MNEEKNRLPSPPPVVRPDFIIREYFGEPKQEQQQVFIEKIVDLTKINSDYEESKSDAEESKSDAEESKSDADDDIDESRIDESKSKILNKGFLIGTGLLGTALGFYILSKGGFEGE